jgi:hypothetical protein
MRYFNKYDPNYLYGEKQVIWWKIIAGPPNRKLSVLEDHDVVFDDYDLKIRKLTDA